LNEGDEPTVLTIEGINAFFEKLKAEGRELLPMTHCTSCGEKLPIMLTHYYTGQCGDCFYSKKPWCQTAPVSDAYFGVESVE